ncbi:glutamine--fructose-6-phosphate transaminase (isomerizing) [Emcibacter sp. SYSU 3D8]|uniref:glutamine--fructose-6-phosphate transaminase (isomerizing) n=1 Tax=Emcibacter sp. SYSU 3D8 TaxID=3133969 RepID=UPI0031FF03B3
MCGIVGIVGREAVTPRLVEGLQRLEYRGYDSAGVATLPDGGAIDRRRAEGKLANLRQVLDASPLAGTVGIAHTRWATHGAPNENNAHPHATEKVAVVHNGIIENFRELREELTAQGHVMLTETDSEVIAHLVTAELDRGMTPQQSAAAALKRLDGAFAIGILFAGHGDLLIGARRGSPLVVGYGDGEMYLGSDALAIGPLSNRICYLAEGDWVVLTPHSAEIHDETGALVQREIKLAKLVGGLIEKGNYRHFMQKEIYEQPAVIGDTLGTYYNQLSREVVMPAMPFDLAGVPKITIVACGTAFYACMVAKYWFERVARVSVEIDVASEFRYREAALPDGGLAIFVSQSGETADTLAALRYCRAQGQHILSVVNVPESSIARESDVVLPTHAGPEIGVASTKAFTCQLVVLACLVIAAARARGTIDAAMEAELTHALVELPMAATDVLKHDDRIEAIAADIAKARDVLYLGRGALYPIALEGALKLKEISYIHAEGYAAGEMKHGPIALIDPAVPVVVLAPSDRLFAKTVSNMHEVIARGGRILLVTDVAGAKATGDGAAWMLVLPDMHEFVAPILQAIPVQLLAYHAAVSKGTDVDQPRNLAKSVTVE